jgi:hypothetical protein
VSESRRRASMLEVARDTLRRELTPGLAPELRYRAAMIANAMAIAGRALAVGAESEARQRAALAAFLGAPATTTVEELRRRLARELRQGRVAAEREAALREVLRRCTLARLEISAPDYPATFAPGLVAAAGRRPGPS